MYSKDSINAFTIIIPSLNRHNYLKRILEFYENYDVNIKIVDSSINRFHSNILLKQNIEYIHLPNMEILDKVIYALEDIKTRYVVFCADDDFIFLDAITRCCSFLEKNHDYVCAQGRLITFKYSIKDNELEFIIENYFKIGDDKITSSNVATRLLDFSNPYRHTFYGVHRTDNLKSIFERIAFYKINEPYLIELTQAILLVLSGKIMNFSSFIYHLRESIKKSSSKYDDIPTLVKINNPQISVVKKIIVKQLRELSNISNQESVNIAENIFNEFCVFVDKKKHLYQQFQSIHINKHNNHMLNELYQIEPDFKLAERLITKHKLHTGFLYSEEIELKNLSKEVSKLNKMIQNLKSKIAISDKIVIYGAGSLAALLIDIFNQQIVFLVDKNESLAEKEVNNKIIKNINFLSSEKTDFNIVLVSVLGRNNEIKNELSKFKLDKVIYLE